MKNLKNIVLIGMPAAGKSTVGVILAKLLGYDFVDTDLLIQKREGKRLEEIIREQGVDGFLAVEEEICCGFTPDAPAVIATGGSVVYEERAMRHLGENGTIIYLELGFDGLIR
jgi:shikimate kinase